MKMNLDMEIKQFKNPLDMQGLDLDAMLKRFDKYTSLFLDDMKKYMFDYFDIQGVDCSSVVKEQSLQYYEYFREQSKRQFFSMEKNLRDTLTSILNIFPTYLSREKLKPYNIQNMKQNSCPNTNEWRNWLMLNFDIFKKNYQKSENNFKKSSGA